MSIVLYEKEREDATKRSFKKELNEGNTKRVIRNGCIEIQDQKSTRI